MNKHSFPKLNRGALTNSFSRPDLLSFAILKQLPETLKAEEKRQACFKPPAGQRRRKERHSMKSPFAFKSCTRHSCTTLSYYCRLLYKAEWVSRIFIWLSRSTELEQN